MVLSIHHMNADVARTTDFSSVMEDFAKNKARKVFLK
jgi:hypothetical protein